MAPQWQSADSGGLRLTLTGDNNETLEGVIHLDNSQLLKHLVHGIQPEKDNSVTTAVPEQDYDPKGAGAYAIVVIFVYGFSIVLLIASHIFLKKKEDKKDGENEKEINKYLEQAPTLQRNSEKESFRKLKKSIIPLVSVGMLAGNIANVPGCNINGTPNVHNKNGNLNRNKQKELQDIIEEDQVSLLLPPPSDFAQQSSGYDLGTENSSQLQTTPMPTIFEGGESDSVMSQEDIASNTKIKDRNIPTSAYHWQPNDTELRIGHKNTVMVHSLKGKQYRPATARILPRNTADVPKDYYTRKLPQDLIYRDQPNIYQNMQYPSNVMKSDDDKLLQVTVL